MNYFTIILTNLGGFSLKRSVFVSSLFLIFFYTANAQTISISSTPSSGTSLKAGDVITYTITASNNTASIISGISISDPIPSSPAVFVPNSLVVGGTDLTCTVPSTITNAVLISGFSLLPGENIVYSFKMKIPATYSGSGTVSHTTTFNPGGITASISNPISAVPSLTVVKSGLTDVTSGTVNKTGLINYTLVVTNTGTATANNVVLTDKLDIVSKVNIVAANNVVVTQSYIGSYTVNKGNTITDDSIRVTLGNIPMGGSATITFKVRVKATATTSVTNTAIASSTNLTAGTSAGTVNSNTTTHTINGATSCSNRNIYYLSYLGSDASAEVNNPNKPWQKFTTIMTLVHNAGGNAVVRFQDAYYPASVSGLTTAQAILDVPCVTIDGNYCIFDRNSGASVAFMDITAGANGDTIRNLRLTNFNSSPNCSFNILGASPASPITGLVMDDVKVYATQSVKATTMQNVSGAIIKNCEWSNNQVGAIDIEDTKAEFIDCNFFCNTRGGFGGAIDARIKSGGAAADAHFLDLKFTRGKFSGNSATGGGGDGGAMSIGCGTVVFDGTEFDCNTSDSPTGVAGGGALRIQSNSGSSLKPVVTVKNAIFYNNSGVTAGTDGGAILSTTSGRLTIDKSIFKANTGTSGSAINVNANTDINNSLFTLNTGGAAIVGNPATFDSTTVKNNALGVSGTIASMTNSLVCSNTGTNMSAHPSTVSNSSYGTSAEVINNATVTLLTNDASTATAGWTFTNPTSILVLNNATSQGTFVFTNTNVTNAIQQNTNGQGGAADGYWLLEDNDVVETPVLSLLNYPGNIVLTYDVKYNPLAIGTQTSTSTVTLQYSTDGGATWLAGNTPTPTASWAAATSFTIPFATTTNNMKLRWFKTTTGATRRDIGIDNIQITYNTSAIQQVGSWGLEATDVITSSNIDVTGLTNLKVQFQVATFAGTTAGTVNTPATFEYSTDGGASWTSNTTVTPTNTTLINAFASPLVIGSPNVANFRMRFSKAAGTNFKGITIDNITLTYDSPLNCASPIGSTMVAGTYACLSACPTTPTGATICITFADLGNISLSGCKFLNTYTGDFATGTPVQLPTGGAAQSMTALVSNFFPVGSPASTYEWRYLVVNPSNTIVQVVTPASHTNVTNTTITPSFSPVVAGTYKVYGYYFNKNSTSAPTVGTTIADLTANICGSLSKSFATFEILNPIVETVTASCASGLMNACPNRYFGSVTITGGYPQYASEHGLAVPQYIIGADKTYTPTTYTNEMTGWVSYGTASNYANSLVVGQSFGVKTEDDGNCTTYPFALDVAAYATPTACNVGLSGGVYNDPDGGGISGTGIHNPSGQQLYAYLISSNGTPCVVARVAVNAGGNYSFGSEFAPNTYTVLLSTDGSISIGSVVLPSTTLPSVSGNSWIHTAEGLTNSGDGSANGVIGSVVVPNGTVISNVNFAIQPPAGFPLDLILFEGFWVDNKSQLTWMTATEKNTAFFGVEHATNGSDYKTIGNVSAAGYSNMLKDYHFVHTNPSIGNNYYRLKMVDVDGSYSYSPTVKILNIDNRNTLEIYPNPSESKAFVLHPISNETAKIRLIDAAGKTISTWDAAAYSTQTSLDLEDVESGVYMLIWEDKKNSLYQKLIKNK